MLTLQEIKLLGEFVDSTVAAGFIKSVQGCAGVAKIAGILQREAANEAAAEQARQDAAKAELKRLANLGSESEKKAAAMSDETQRHVDSGLGLEYRGLCPPYEMTSFDAGSADVPKVG